MRSKLKLSKKYIKTYKESSFSIVMSIILSISLIVGVITLKETNNNLELQNMRYESGIYDANFEKINKNQVEKLMSYKSIENLGLKSVYKQTSSSERQNIEIVGANDEYILNNSMIKKGRLPKNSKEIIAEEWVLRNFGITPKVDKEITLKVKDKNDKTKEEKFKLVGILSDKAMEKSAAKMQLFVPIDLENHENIEASLSFKKDVDIYLEIKKICNDCKIKNENVYLNNDMISLKMSNNRIDINDIKILIIMAFVCFIVINGIFNISVCKRINEYGILRAIGFNKFDIFKLIINEVMTLYFISIPIGVILGILGANIFNNFAKNVNTEFIFNGRIVEIGMVYPSFLIILSIILIGVINILISILSYIQINKLSIVDSINKNFNIKNKKIEILKTNYLKKFIKGYNIISFKNIFRNKMRFLEIILSMSICGVMFISLNYKLELDMNMTSEGFKSQFMNGDFMVDEFLADTTMTGISSKSYKELSKISGVENIESSMVMPSRMVIDKNDISNKEYFKNINDSSKDMYFKSLLDKDKKTKEIILKNNIKGYNDNALKKMNDYLLSGNVNLKDMKEKDLAILYIPQIVGDNPFPKFNKNGKNVLDIKVGDKIKVKFRKDRDVSSDDYWTMNDKGDYEYKTFEVGAISYYPYMNETSVIGYSTVEVIISEENFRKIMGIDAYTSLNVNLKKGIDDRKIEGEILDIVSKDKDVITRNIVKEKENIKAIHKKRKIYNLGISLIVLLIAIINIVNNIKYNIITRKKEYGILRAVALDRINLEKMIAFEGILYGILSSVLSVIVAFFMQKIIYELSGVRNIGIEFSINYLNYITIIILNIILGFFTTYIQSKKISKLNIIECIKKDE